METIEQIAPEAIRNLVNSTGPCVTLVLSQNPVEVKEVLQSIRSELKNRGVDPESLLAPVLEEIRNSGGQNGSRHPVAIFRSPDVLLSLEAQPEVKQIARVGENFDLRTILSVTETLKRFFILALSQKRTRILECTRRSIHELPFPEGFPSSLDESKETKPPDHMLDNRSSAGPSVGTMKGVMFGTSSDREAKDEYLLHFMMDLDKAVNIALKGREEPLVVVGVEHEIALYRRVNTYKALVEGGVHGSPDGLEMKDLLQRASELIDQRPGLEIATLLADLDKKIGSGHASVQMQEVIAAAYQGRVFHFFFQEDAHYSGIFDAVRQRVKHTEDPLDQPVDLIESAALQTLAHSGEVHMLPASAMPNGVPVCALLRYPLPS